MTTINKLIMRLHTEETAALEQNDPASWTLQRGLGALERVAITEIVNPIAQAKTLSEDVPCVNGAADLTEAAGQIFYKNKPVQITVQTLSSRRKWFSALQDAFTALQGRVVDFAFDTALEVRWYYTGRLSVESADEPSGKIKIKIDTYPFLQSVEKRRYDIPTATSLDRSGSGWTVEVKSATAKISLREGWFVAFGQPGDQIILKRTAETGQRFTLGVAALRGGDYRFADGSRTLGVPSDFGNLILTLTIDGSYYDWTTVDGERVYMPSLLFRYILTELETDGNGDVLGADGKAATDPRCAVVLPTNVRIRPELYNFGTGPADVLLDGTRILVEEYSAYRDVKQYPAAVLPGIRADRSGEKTVCILSAVGNASTDEPAVQIRYREEKLG